MSIVSASQMAESPAISRLPVVVYMSIRWEYARWKVESRLRVRLKPRSDRVR